MTLDARQPYDLEIAAQLYDDVMADRMADIDVFLSLADEFGGPVLELGCGTGRCLIPLIRAGYDVVGIDASEPMLRRLRENLSSQPDEIRYRATYFKADYRFYSLPLRFGMAFVAVNSFLHLPTKADQEVFVANAFGHLRPGGILAIDVFNPDLARLLGGEEYLHQQVRDIDIVHEIRGTDLAEQTRHYVTTYYREGERLARVEWDLRYVFRYELEHLLEKSGFELIHLWGDHGRRPFGEATTNLFAVARKPGREEASAVEEARAVVTEFA